MARTKGARDKRPRTTSTVESAEKRLGPGFFKGYKLNSDGSERKGRSDANVRKNWVCPENLYELYEQGKITKL